MFQTKRAHGVLDVTSGLGVS